MGATRSCFPFPPLSAFLLPAGFELAELRPHPREHFASQEERPGYQDRLRQFASCFHRFLHRREDGAGNAVWESNTSWILTARVLYGNEKKSSSDWRQRREHFIQVFVA